MVELGYNYRLTDIAARWAAQIGAAGGVPRRKAMARGSLPRALAGHRAVDLQEVAERRRSCVALSSSSGCGWTA